MTFSYVSLFSGAGGLDVGLERCGFQAKSLNEIEPNFCRSLMSNQGWLHADGFRYFSEAQILQGDIRDMSVKDMFKERGRPDLVVGGPPCQAFSSAGKQLSVLDARGALISEYVRAIDQLKPKAFLLENVRGLVTARGRDGVPGSVLTEIISRLEECGYSVRATLVNAADYGATQRRVRCFLIGSSRGTAPDIPAATHAKNGANGAAPWRALGDFLQSHADEDPKEFVFPSEELLPKLSVLPDGKGLKSIGRVEPTRPGGHWGYRQGTFIADLTLPARTVTGSSSQDWVRWGGHLRRLTLREVSLLQGFPSDWIFCGTKGQRFKQIGNAVPAIFGEVIGGVLHEHLTNFPKSTARKLPLPKVLKGYISYTIRDGERNKAARTIQNQFQ